jgi:hypothetical protein
MFAEVLGNNSKYIKQENMEYGGMPPWCMAVAQQ